MDINAGRDDDDDGYLNHDADDTLDAHDENGFGTLFGGVARPVADRVLRFDAEQEARRETVDVEHARLPSRIVLIIYQSSMIIFRYLVINIEKFVIFF